MAEKTSNYPAKTTIHQDDLLDISNTEDGGSTYNESQKATINELIAYINANAETLYNADGTLSGNRIISAANLITTFDGGSLSIKSDGINDNAYFIFNDSAVLRGGIGYDVSLDSATFDFIDALGSYFKGSDGEVSARDGYSLDGVLSFHNNGVVNNIFVGKNSGTNATGISNVGVGLNALAAVTTGTKNTATGSSALQAITVGGSNSAFGSSALIALNTTASNSNNTATGTKSLQQLTEGNKNTSIGASSGGTMTTGDGCTFLGYLTGSIASGDYNNSIALGHGAKLTGDNQFVVGGSGSVAPIENMYIGRGVSQVGSLSSFTLNATGIASGTTDGSAAASVFNIAGARGTGTGLGGDVTIQTAPAGTTGSTQNPLVDALIVQQDGVTVFKTFTLATLPTVIAGGQIFVSDATGASLTGSMCFSNGTVWIDPTTGIAVA